MLHRSIERKAERTACIQYSIETLLLLLPSLLLHYLYTVYPSITISIHSPVHPLLYQPLHHCLNLITPPVQHHFVPSFHLSSTYYPTSSPITIFHIITFIYLCICLSIFISLSFSPRLLPSLLARCMLQLHVKK